MFCRTCRRDPLLATLDHMANWLDDRIYGLRGRLTPADEGSLWLLFLDGPRGEVILASAFADAMAHVDAQMTRNLVRILDHVPAVAVLLAVPRADGRPLPVDRQLWSDLEGHDAIPLVDLVVVGETDYWSARSAAA